MSSLNSYFAGKLAEILIYKGQTALLPMPTTFDSCANCISEHFLLIFLSQKTKSDSAKTKSGSVFTVGAKFGDKGGFLQPATRAPLFG